MNSAVALPAELNIYAVAQTHAGIKQASATAAGETLEIDCSAVQEVDGAGLQLLLALALGNQRGDLAARFSGIPAALSDQLARIGLTDLLADVAQGCAS